MSSAGFMADPTEPIIRRQGAAPVAWSFAWVLAGVLAAVSAPATAQNYSRPVVQPVPPPALGDLEAALKTLSHNSSDVTALLQAGWASLGLGDHLAKRPDQLSGGQRQRVAVARALANDPPVILADEPTGSLDSQASEQVFQILRDLVDRHGKTVVAVTHDLGLAERMDRRVHLVDGRIVASGGMELAEELEREGYEAYQ